jgi:NTE family protein
MMEGWRMPDGSKMVVVFGGGGIWGVAWMTGLVAGLADAGVDLRTAGRFIGTSAGSVVASQLTGPLDTETLYARQTDPDKQPREQSPPPGTLEAMTELLQKPWASDEDRLRAVCELAGRAETIPAAERRADVAGRLGLPSAGWPAKALSITAVDMATLDLIVFDAQSGVDLVDAVTASCAVPGVWPPAEFGGRRYVDGGVWKTAENAHLAEGAKSVLILSPLGRIGGVVLGAADALAADIKRLEDAGADVVVVYADAASLQAMASNPLEPSTRKPAAEAGRRQAAVEADRLRHLF